MFSSYSNSVVELSLQTGNLKSTIAQLWCDSQRFGVLNQIMPYRQKTAAYCTIH